MRDFVEVNALSRLFETDSDYVIAFVSDSYGLLSTFLPTVLHAIVTCFSLVARIPDGPRQWVQGWLPRAEDDWQARWLASLTVTAMIAFAIAVPVMLGCALVFAVWHFAPGLNDWYLWLFEEFTICIGAAVPERPMPAIIAV